MENEKVKQLHQTVVDAVIKVKTISKNHQNSEDEKLTIPEKFSEAVSDIVSSWTSICLFATFVILWIVYNMSVPVQHSFDPFPFSLMTFLLAGIAAIQAPLIMMSQRWQNHKNSKRLAENLNVENEILALHRSITILMEQQLQQVHENQAITIKLLQGLHLKSDQQSNP